VDQSTIPDKRLSSFVTSNTKNFLQVLAILDSFLATNPYTWLSNSDYMVAEDIVRELRVVNDTAERGVALKQEFNALLTKDEEQTQFAIQVIKEYRKRYLDSKNETLLKGLGPVG